MTADNDEQHIIRLIRAAGTRAPGSVEESAACLDVFSAVRKYIQPPTPSPVFRLIEKAAAAETPADAASFAAAANQAASALVQQPPTPSPTPSPSPVPHNVRVTHEGALQSARQDSAARKALCTLLIAAAEPFSKGAGAWDGTTPPSTPLLLTDQYGTKYQGGFTYWDLRNLAHAVRAAKEVFPPIPPRL